MPFSWNEKRFARASEQYRKELMLVNSQLRKRPMNGSESFVRKCLGDFIGRAIRFHLRRFFNPVPLHLHSDSDDLPDYSNTRSRIHEIVEMRDTDDGGRDTATADGSISSVMGIALQRMIHFFELNSEIVARRENQSDSYYADSFCVRPASVRGLKESGGVIELSEDDVQEILLDIEEGNAFLAGIRACRFINALLTWPGVSDAIEEAGGWGKIESLATIFQDCTLSSEMLEESHFILLSNVKGLLNKIVQDSDELKIVEQTCEDSLRNLWKRFRCGTRIQELLQLNPCINIFQRELMAGKQTRFPSIVEATEWA